MDACCPWKQDVESCDRVGLMQMLPAGDAEKDVEGRRWEHRKDLMRDAMIYYRNSPSRDVLGMRQRVDKPRPHA